MLHIRLRTGKAASPRGVLRFAHELIDRVGRADATGPKLLRADSAFWNKKLIARLDRVGWSYSISIAQQPWVRAGIAPIPEHAWQTLCDYPEGGEAQIAETKLNGHRLIVPPHPPDRPARRAVARLAALRVHHQPHRTARTGRGRASRSRRLRARDSRSQRPSTGALPLRQVHRQTPLDRDRLPAHNLLRWTTLIGLPPSHRAHLTHAPTPTALTPRPTDHQRPSIDTSPAIPLALATRLHPGTRAHTRFPSPEPANPTQHNQSATPRRSPPATSSSRHRPPNHAAPPTPPIAQHDPPRPKNRSQPPPTAPAPQLIGGSRLRAFATFSHSRGLSEHRTAPRYLRQHRPAGLGSEPGARPAVRRQSRAGREVR